MPRGNNEACYNFQSQSLNKSGVAMRSSIQVGHSHYLPSQTKVIGKYITLSGERFYCIENYDQMPPFFMSIVSNADHWMFISSTGGLAAGRQNSESALFPYETDDKITESFPNTGPLSIFLVTRGEITYLWEPFSDRYEGLYQIERKIYKNVSGNKLIFEESNLDLGLTYRRSWRTSDKFGFVLTSWLHNQSPDPAHIQLLSGVQNILPFGATTRLQSTFSNLLNAYKRSELEMESGLGIFSLSSTLTDLAEPSESLKATTVWQVGLEQPVHVLSTMQLDKFRKGIELTKEVDIRGRRGAYLLNATLTLEKDESRDWRLVLEVNQDIANMAALINLLKRPTEQVIAVLESDIAMGGRELDAIVASADGLQVTGDRLSSAHHYANVLFNTMRGGIFADHYQVDKQDLIGFLETRNRPVLEQNLGFLDELPETFRIEDLLARATEMGDPNLERLCYGYLPLTFSRRHGDPSRPWNQFSINLKNNDGSKRLDYQGNWRDLFQNWEALACSYPEYLENMIATFVNAGTADGYNPYRVTREGVEWEVPEPDNPWANIGYWSDHQIIYLVKLLELSSRYHPGKLSQLLTQPIFCYANVPYRLKLYSDLVQDPYQTIDFDHELHNQIEKKAVNLGSDAKLVHGPDGNIYHVNLTEKLLAFLLAKLVNYVPEGGIWMNTQRPEWNDANNALVGKGLSVVTLGYLRRYIVIWLSLLEEMVGTTLDVSRELKTLLNAIQSILSQFESNLNTSFSNRERRWVMDALGQAGSDFRWQIYKQGFCGELEPLQLSQLRSFLTLVCQYIEHALQANQRSDGLFHAYNTLKLRPNTAEISYLDEMLEGQVSILSSGLLTPQEALVLLGDLRESALYRADQHSYILYPDRDLPAFVKKNRLPPAKTWEIDLVQVLVNNNERSLIVQDENGDFHFNGEFRNARDVRQALAQLSKREPYAELVAADEAKILALFEAVFSHDRFTGRSGTFFAYEGLGSIYWHMVSKLLLASQENYLLALNQGADTAIIQGLAECYYDIRKGLGFNKSPELYGAFPTDPYSHTPKGQGAKQPGMTGQVKEEVLTRQVELGVFVKEGRISFDPILLQKDEFLIQPTIFEFFTLARKVQRVELPPGSLAFTFCQTLIIYHNHEEPGLEIHFADGKRKNIPGSQLDDETSRHIFKRDGIIEKIVVSLGQPA
jgi:hypothetical protein